MIDVAIHRPSLDGYLDLRCTMHSYYPYYAFNRCLKHTFIQFLFNIDTF